MMNLLLVVLSLVVVVVVDDADNAADVMEQRQVCSLKSIDTTAMTKNHESININLVLISQLRMSGFD